MEEGFSFLYYIVQEKQIFGPGVGKMGYAAGVLAAAGEQAVEMAMGYGASQGV